MVGRVAWAWSLVFVGLALAGCSHPPAADPIVGSVAPPAEGKGNIAGVVVDEAIRPVAHVEVTVIGQPLNASTDANGLFSIPDLAPGLYTLSAAAKGFLAIQTTAEVKAGETAKVRMALATDKTPQPYHSTLKFDWFDQEGVTLVDFTVDLVNRDFLNRSLPPMCDLCYFDFPSDGPVDTFVVEAVWEDSIPDSAEGTTEYFWTLDNHDSGDYAADYFSSPGRATVAGESIGNGTHYGIGMSADEDWVTYQQKAEIFLTMFYRAPPPDGWSFVDGDA
jgi:hypothetical protein